MNGKSERNKFLYILLGIGIAPFLINGLYNPFLSFYPIAYWVVEILTWVILPFCILYFGLSNKIFSLKELGFHMNIGGKRNVPIFILAIVLIPFLLVILDYVFIGNLVHDLFPNNYFKINFGYRSMIPEASTLLWMLTVLYMAFSAGFVEEFYYRGVMRLMFGDGTSQAIAFVLISSLIFSLVHWEGGIQNLFEAWVFGIVASIIYLWMKNIWPLIVGHCLNDILWFW